MFAKLNVEVNSSASYPLFGLDANDSSHDSFQKTVSLTIC